MIVDTKKWPLQDIKDMIAYGNCVNIHSDEVNTNPVERYYEKMPQVNIFAHYDDDKLIIRDNDIIKKLSSINTHNLSRIEIGRLQSYELQIEILHYSSSKEEVNKFISLL